MLKNPFKRKPKKEEPKKANWETIPIELAVKKDFAAAISLMQLVLDDPEVFKLVCSKLEGIRKTIIEERAKIQSNGSTKPKFE